jgi:hypothetical protein
MLKKAISMFARDDVEMRMHYDLTGSRTDILEDVDSVGVGGGFDSTRKTRKNGAKLRSGIIRKFGKIRVAS